jgi:hypothetical protein
VRDQEMVSSGAKKRLEEVDKKEAEKKLAANATPKKKKRKMNRNGPEFHREPASLHTGRSYQTARIGKHPRYGLAIL